MTHIRLALLGLAATLALVACDQKKPTTDTPATEQPTASSQEAAPEETPKQEEAKAPAEVAAADDSDKESKTYGTDGKTPEDIKPGESNIYGKHFTIIEPPITLASAIEKASTGNEGPYKVEATVEKVCQKRGCWFTLKGEGVELPIRVMPDYKFLVPRNAAGLPVVLEGTFKKTVIPQEEAQHYADDEAENTGKPARKVEGDQDSWIFTAVSAQIDNKKG